MLHRGGASRSVCAVPLPTQSKARALRREKYPVETSIKNARFWDKFKTCRKWLTSARFCVSKPVPLSMTQKLRASMSFDTSCFCVCVGHLPERNGATLFDWLTSKAILDSLDFLES